VNRKRFWLLGIIVVPLVFGACASQIIFDKNLPLEESTHLLFAYTAWSSIEVTEYNGIPVPQTKFLLDTYSKWHDVYLPPGEMEFMYNGHHSFGGGVTIKRGNLFFKYKFEAGKNYIIYFVPFGGGPDNNQTGVDIYTAPSPKTTRPRDEDFIAFVPVR
jgi:hypothetical protein